ncbi:MAG: hypothetical protein AB7S92_05475 [Parvibaculaceae bacterium]
MSESKAASFLALADFLIPAHRRMPSFSMVCSHADALAALDFRVDLKEPFGRAVPQSISGGEEEYLDALCGEDEEAFTALTTIVICTYYMNPEVRALIGYPGQENVAYETYATQSYITDGSLEKVLARGRKYRPTPGL